MVIIFIKKVLTNILNFHTRVLNRCFNHGYKLQSKLWNSYPPLCGIVPIGRWPSDNSTNKLSCTLFLKFESHYN